MSLTLVKTRTWVPEDLEAKLRQWDPRTDLGKMVKGMLHYLPVEQAAELYETISRSLVAQTQLELTQHFRNGRSEYLGVVGNKSVTDVGVGYIVDAWQNIVELENMKYHGYGTGTTAESAAHTALVTELTTEYTGNVRPTGTTAESSAPVFVSVATMTVDEAPGAALREHGLFSASSAGVMFDRTLFAAVTLGVGEAVTGTYSLTLTAGG